jgi:hypothetical protein
MCVTSGCVVGLSRYQEHSQVLPTYLDNPTTQPGLTDISRQSNNTARSYIHAVLLDCQDMSARPGCNVGLSRYICKTSFVDCDVGLSRYVCQQYSQVLQTYLDNPTTQPTKEVLHTYQGNPTTQSGLTDISRQSNITVNKRDLTDISRQ